MARKPISSIPSGTAVKGTIKYCEYCGEPFLAQRNTAKYCCDAHRQYAFRQESLLHKTKVLQFMLNQAISLLEETDSCPGNGGNGCPGDWSICLIRRDCDLYMRWTAYLAEQTKHALGEEMLKNA